MSVLPQDLATLSPQEKRALLAQLLEQKERQPKSCPLSFGQERLWFLDQLAPGNPAYNIFTAVHIKGQLYVAAFERSLVEVVRRHETLRTTFPAVDGQPVQLIAPTPQVELTRIDLTAVVADERDAEVRRLAEAEHHKPFNLATGPLLRVGLIALGVGDHVLLVTMHHIISDGWSLNVFVREIVALYEAYSRAQPSPLPELKLQYADYATRQRQLLQGDVLEQQLTYWRQQLADLPPLLELPTDRPRPALQTFRGASESLTLSDGLAERLNTLSRREGATLFMTMLAAFEALLHRYTGADDITTGIPIAGRQHRETEDLIGFFVNTQVIRVRPVAAQEFRQLLAETREAVLGAHEHQDLPFELLVEALQPQRSMSHSPLAQVGFAFGVTSRETVEVSGLTLHRLSAASETTKFDLTLYVVEDGPRLHLNLEYNTDIFDAESARRLLRHYERLLVGAAGDCTLPLCELPLLTGAEKQLLLADWNATRAVYESDATLVSLFERQVARTPDAPALAFEDQELSYRELNARANTVGQRLRAMGVEAESVVGVFMERSVELVVSLLGVLKSGGAYLPLEPSYPRERLALMLEDARPPVLLTQPHLRELLPPTGTQVLELNKAGSAIGESAAEAGNAGADEPANVVAGVSPENAAYVIYTSGSTGRPKAVVNVHRAICNRLLWMQHEYQLSAADTVLQKTPFSFDVSVWEFFWPLLAGARLVVARPGGHQDPAYLVRLITQERVTVMHFVPAMLQVFLETEGVEECKSLRDVICSGEALAYELQERFFARLPARLHNLYGPTEAAVDVTYWECRRGDARSVVPIGKPIANTQIYLLDERMRPVPVGIGGELHIGGVGLARGYMNRPGLTAQRFIPDPFATHEGARLYRTGDLARYLADGSIEFLGRLDHQVKLRGFRIELSEIEAVARTHEAIAESVVTLAARKQAEGEVNAGSDQRLVCYVVPDAVSARAVRRRLRLERDGVLKEQPHLELPNGMLVFGRNRQEAGFMYDEIFASRSYLRHGIELTEDTCVFDVGANIGLFTVFVATECPRARVYSFEPIPELYELLRLNTDLYAAGSQIFAYGLGVTEQEVTFTYYPNVSIISGRHADVEQDQEVVRRFLRQQQEVVSGFDEAEIVETVRQRLESRQVEARLRPLSQVIRELGIEQIDLLKIDVEKSEEEVLAGLRDEDWTRIKQLVMEVHDENGRVARVGADLRARGYEVVVEQDQTLQGTGLFNVYARRPAKAAQLSNQSRNGARKSWLSPRQLTTDLDAYLRKQLPEFMVPSDYVLLDELPLSSSGKVNRRALPAPNEEAHSRAAAYVAPRNALESQLVQMWEDLLRKRPIGVTESFFKLGGHSLLAVRLMARIKKELGQDLPVSTLFSGETVEQLARILGEQSSAWRWAPLVPIQPRGSQPAFYCVHALGGNVNNYYLLSRYLGDDQPFYGLQAPPLHDVREEDSQIELMAARYVAAIREVQPAGPYHVGGYSFGSFVAYEMARQLRELGEEVALLALLDTYSPTYLNKLPDTRDLAEMLVGLAWATSREQGKKLLLPVEVLRALDPDEQLAYFLDRMREEDLVPPEVDEELLRRFLYGTAARERAARQYVPQSYDGAITVFRCEERDPLWVERLVAAGLPPDDQTFGWGELTPEPVNVIDIPGHHDVICQEPFVQTLAQHLRACLAAAAAEQKHSTGAVTSMA